MRHFKLYLKSGHVIDMPHLISVMECINKFTFEFEGAEKESYSGDVAYLYRTEILVATDQVLHLKNLNHEDVDIRELIKE